MATLALAVFVTALGCKPLSPSAVGGSQGGTGAFGIVVVGGKQKLYLPLDNTHKTANGHGQIAVVDVGLSGAGVTGVPAQIALIDLGSADLATTTAGDSSVIVAASAGFPDIWLIDPTTDAITKSIQLDVTVYGRSKFSGGLAYVSGIAMDTANHRAFLSVWNGFITLDTSSGSITGSMAVPSPENFGFDPVAQRLYAPFYECSSAKDPAGNPPPFCSDYTTASGAVMSDGLNVIDVATGDIFTYEDSSAADPQTPLGVEPDAASVDPASQLAVVPSEVQSIGTVLDMSHATFDGANKRFTAPHNTVTTEVHMDGVAVESSRSLTLLETEFGSTVGLFDLNAANAGSHSVIIAQLPSVPGGGNFRNGGDPHGVAVATAILGGRPVGFVYDSFTFWVARIDLLQMQSLGSSGTVTDLSSAVTYLNPLQR